MKDYLYRSPISFSRKYTPTLQGTNIIIPPGEKIIFKMPLKGYILVLVPRRVTK